jgi:uncharacterized protein DUF5004
MQKGALCILILAGLTAGCKQQQPGFVGSWETNTSVQKEDPKIKAQLLKLGMKQTAQSKARMTFNADNTMSFSASEVPGQMHYILKGVGTWSATATDLTVTPASMELTELPADYIAKLKPSIDQNLNKPQTGKFEWKGPDEFILTKPNLAPQDFKRIQ